MITVTFIDETTSEPIGTVDLPVENLPETFEVETTLTLGDARWSVMHADPATKAEFASSGKLTLRLHRIEMVDLSDLLYSLPSICDRLPGTEGTPPSADDLVLAEDDWRQFELVSGAFSEQTEAEIAAIRVIHEQQSDGVGWKKTHVRRRPDPPIASTLSRQDISRAFGKGEFAGVCFGRSTITSGFSFSSGDLRCYGIEEDGAVILLGIAHGTADEATAEALVRLAHEFDLELVQWCRCVRARWDDPPFVPMLIGAV